LQNQRVLKKQENNVDMSFKLLLCTPEGLPDHNLNHWPELLQKEIPGIEVKIASSEREAIEAIGDIDAAFGNINSDIFKHAKKLRWISCPQAGPPAGWYHEDLIDSNVVVTNTREIYNDHISTHILSFILMFSRGLNRYFPHQLQQKWRNIPYPVTHLPDATILIVGVGGIGRETARLCKSFGMNVLGSDPRLNERPVHVDELFHPDDIDDPLGRADFVVSTVPETPSTRSYFDKTFFNNMKTTSIFINIGRGATVVLSDLNDALRSGQLAGAGLDVFEIEPLPSNHPLWSAPGVIITPHIAGEGPYLPARRTDLFIENCKRFAKGEELLNVVDKQNWF